MRGVELFGKECYVTCPHCGRDYVPTPGQTYCSFCGGRLDAAKGPEEETSADREDPRTFPKPGGGFTRPENKYCPWEDQENLGFVQGIGRTIKESLFSPQEFFARLPIEGGVLVPLLYALIIETVGTMVSALWGLAMNNPLFPETGLSGNVTTAATLLIPLLVFLGIVLSALLLHVSLLIVGGATENFEATFRVVCYSAAAELFNVIPLVGWIIALVWKLYITLIGLRTAHRITTARAAIAIFLPLIAACGLVIGGIALTVLTLGWGSG
jgi:hypothetical protein